MVNRPVRIRCWVGDRGLLASEFTPRCGHEAIPHLSLQIWYVTQWTVGQSSHVPGMQSILLRSQRMCTPTGLDASTTFANLLSATSTSLSAAFTNISDSASTVFTQARVEHQGREYWF